jgi:hypothetical protein
MVLCFPLKLLYFYSFGHFKFSPDHFNFRPYMCMQRLRASIWTQPVHSMLSDMRLHNLYDMSTYPGKWQAIPPVPKEYLYHDPGAMFEVQVGCSSLAV